MEFSVGTTAFMAGEVNSENHKLPTIYRPDLVIGRHTFRYPHNLKNVLSECGFDDQPALKTVIDQKPISQKSFTRGTDKANVGVQLLRLTHRGFLSSSPAPSVVARVGR